MLNGEKGAIRPYHRVPTARALAPWSQYSQVMPSNAAAPGVHPPNEQYLEAILTWKRREPGHTGPPGGARRPLSANRLRNGAPSEGGRLHRGTGRSLSLTGGAKLATGVIRKHRLAERLLTDIIGLPGTRSTPKPTDGNT